MDACKSPVSIPPDPDFVPDKGPAVVPFHGGIFVVGGAADSRGSRYWLPGDDEWTIAKRMKNDHFYGAAIALDGDTTVLAVGNLDAAGAWNAGTEIYDLSTGKWTSKQNIIERTVNAVFVAKNDNEIYLFGGEQKDHMGSNALPNVLKYDRLTNKWTILANPMPRGGPHPSCGKAIYQSKSVAICLGTATNLGGEIDIFDFETETWTILPDTIVPPPATYGSLVMSVGTKLYKIRGYDPDGKETNSMSVFNLETETWELPAVQLEASSAGYKDLVLLPNN